LPRKPQFTISDIIESAFKLVRKGGWPKLSASAVADQLGCSTMPIYSHFKNMGKLQDEVVKKGWGLIQEYESKRYTGDAWVDQAIGYVHFAQKEKNLFMCMFDGRNLKLQRKMLREHWVHLSRLLDNYKDFSGLDEKQSLQIRYSRGMLTHGVATSISMGWSFLPENNKAPFKNNEVLAKYLTLASQALLKGFKEVIARNDGDNHKQDKPLK